MLNDQYPKVIVHTDEDGQIEDTVIVASKDEAEDVAKKKLGYDFTRKREDKKRFWDGYGLTVKTDEDDPEGHATVCLTDPTAPADVEDIAEQESEDGDEDEDDE